MKKEELFQQVYRDNYRKVISLCLGFVNGDPDLAKDLAQEIFIKVWKHMDSFRNEASYSTWIYRITVNTCLTNSRKKKLSRLSIDVAAEENQDLLKQEQQFQSMYRCIDKLLPLSKSIILLELEQLPQKEIAEIMGMTHEALRTRIHRIKSQLSKCVKNG